MNYILTLLYLHIVDFDHVHPSITLSAPTLLFPFHIPKKPHWLMSFLLSPDATYERNHGTLFFGRPSLYCLSLLQFQSLSCKWQNGSLLCGWIKLQCAYIPYLFMHSFIDGHLGWFHSLALYMVPWQTHGYGHSYNVLTQVLLGIYSEVVYSNSIFNLLRSPHRDFLGGWD